MSNVIQKVATTDMAQSNLWLGYKQEVAATKGADLDMVIPVPRSAIREISISVCHDSLGKFMTAPSSQELVIPIDKLVLNHKFQPMTVDQAKSTIVYLKTETSTSMTIHFNKFSTDYFTGGKVSWR